LRAGAAPGGTSIRALENPKGKPDTHSSPGVQCGRGERIDCQVVDIYFLRAGAAPGGTSIRALVSPPRANGVDRGRGKGIDGQDRDIHAHQVDAAGTPGDTCILALVKSPVSPGIQCGWGDGIDGQSGDVPTPRSTASPLVDRPRRTARQPNSIGDEA
ncbi:MAG TPA: hypothetical protein VMT57_09255, partial [Candidatus Thermoplasmatota archaeon]|nr:hypothetical protein [Candidatus Thermoplasmatota archaeon]